MLLEFIGYVSVHSTDSLNARALASAEACRHLVPAICVYVTAQYRTLDILSGAFSLSDTWFYSGFVKMNSFNEKFKEVQLRIYTSYLSIIF